MPTFEGCVEAREISLTRKGANQRAHVLVRKTAAVAADPKLETKPMSTLTDAEKAAAATRAAEITKAALTISNKIAGMSDVTKAYYLGLEEDKQIAFLEKSTKDMDDEAAEAAAAAKAKASADAAKAAGVTAREQELQKRLDDQSKEIDALKAVQADRDIEKRAAVEFDGYPGGIEKVVPLLKAYAKLPEADRLASEEVLKAQAKLGREASKTLGARSQEDITKADAANARIVEAAKKLSEDSKIPYTDAYERTIEKREFADDVAAIQA